MDLIIIVVVMLAFNALLMSKQSGYYPLYPAPFFALLAGAAIENAFTQGGPARVGASILLLLAVATAVPRIVVPRIAASHWQADSRDYDRVAHDIEALVPPNVRVWTTSAGWYALASDGRSVRTPSLDYNERPNARVDDYAVLRSDAPMTEVGFAQIGHVGSPLPSVFGRTFANTDYRMTVYRSLLRR